MTKKIKKKWLPTGCILIGFVVMIAGSCENPELAGSRMELDKATTQLKTAQAENQSLKQKLSQLEKVVRQLHIEKEMLAAKQNECDQWSKKIIANHGTGIWYLDEFTLPVFVKSMPDATVVLIISELNQRYEKDRLPKLSLKKMANATAIIGVDDGDILTLQMGTHGATSYIQSAFFSITSVSGIDCVLFEFQEGDHAIPGKYCR
jgi:hypothetical protein